MRVAQLHFYFTTGVPEANRVLLDIWIAEAQLLGGALYVMAGRGSGGGRSSRIAMVYLIASIFVLATLVKTERSEEG
jgi:hypothetical protein